MILPGQIIDLAKLFQGTFGGRPYVINKAGELESDPQEPFRIDGRSSDAEKEFTAKGSLIKDRVKGIDIVLPLKFYSGSSKTTELLMDLPYCVVSIRGRKHVIKTPLVERKGTVKELYSVDDYSMTVKGFLISEDRSFPEAMLEKMKELCEKKTAVVVDNALFNIFLTDPDLGPDEQGRVVILDYDFPEVQGGRHARPFVLALESDFIFTLEIES